PERERQDRFAEMCRCDIPCLVVCRGRTLPPPLLRIANANDVTVYRTSMSTMRFVNACTMRLDNVFAPTTSEHGCMVDVQGIGVLIRGDSGLGKSEAVLGLLERGASLVADDLVHF